MIAAMLIGLALLLGGVTLIIAGIQTARTTLPLAQVRGRLMLSTGVLVVVVVLVSLGAPSVPELRGRLNAAAPLLAATGAVMAFGVLPWRDDRPAGRRIARLQRRSIADVLRARTLIAPVAVTTLLLAALAICVTVAAPDQQSFVFRSAGSASFVFGFPGWLVTGPVLACLFLLVLASGQAVRRMVLMPPVSSDLQFDRQWRRSVVDVLVSLITVALLAEASWALASAGTAFRILTDAARAAGNVPAPLLVGITSFATPAATVCTFVWPLLLAGTIMRAALIGRRARAASSFA